MVQYQNRIKRPDIEDIRAAIEIYYTKEAIGNKELESIFGKHGKDLFYDMKKVVREVEITRGRPIYMRAKVSTDVAYEVWGIDIKELEGKLEKMEKLKSKLIS